MTNTLLFFGLKSLHPQSWRAAGSKLLVPSLCTHFKDSPLYEQYALNMDVTGVHYTDRILKRTFMVIYLHCIIQPINGIKLNYDTNKVVASTEDTRVVSSIFPGNVFSCLCVSANSRFV